MFRELIFVLIILISGCALQPIEQQRCPSSGSLGQCEPLFEGNVGLQESRLESTAGFEFEGTVPEEMEFFVIAESVRDFLKEQFPGDSVSIETEINGWYDNTYYITHQRDGWEDRYSIKPETGVQFDSVTDPNIKPVEITSPILRTRRQAADFFELLEHLRGLGLKSRSDKEGNHIHWGLREDITYDELLVIFEAVEKLLGVFQKEFAYNPSRQEGLVDIPHFVSVVEQLREFVADNPGKKIFVRPYSKQDSGTDFEPVTRRTILRLVPIYKTLELRIFNSNINAEVNQFAFDFTTRLFSEGFRPQSNLIQYLRAAEEPEIERVMQLMKLNVESARRAFQWSNQRVKELKESLAKRRSTLETSRYVMPTRSEAVVDIFWEQDFEIDQIERRVLWLVESVSEKDQNITLFNLISHKKFEFLKPAERQVFLQAVENSVGLTPFMKKEIWAIRAVEDPTFGKILSEEVAKMKSEDLTLLHPLIRRMLLFYKKQPEKVALDMDQLSGEEKSLRRFFSSYEKYLRLRSQRITEEQALVLTEIIKASPHKQTAFDILNLINTMKFPIRKNRSAAIPIFDALQSVARVHRMVALEILWTLGPLTQNDLVKPDYYISKQKDFLDIIAYHMDTGSFPKLLTAWSQYLGLVAESISPEDGIKYLGVIERALKRYGSEITGTERANLSMNLEPLLKNSENPAALRTLGILKKE